MAIFDFLTKKTYLRDLLGGFCDTHSHLLWGVDDGAPTQKHTTQLSDALAKLGFENIYLTPHIIYGLYDNLTEAQLRQHFTAQEPHPTINYRLAAEYFLDEKFIDHVTAEEEKMLTLGDNHLLVEWGLQTTRLTHLEELFEASLAGYNIIIAHPERYAFVCEGNQRQVEKLTSRGYAMQLNLMSIVGTHGKKVQAAAEELLMQGKYTFVGSDTHTMRYVEHFEEATLRPKVAEALKPLIENNKNILWK